MEIGEITIRSHLKDRLTPRAVEIAVGTFNQTFLRVFAITSVEGDQDVYASVLCEPENRSKTLAPTIGRTGVEISVWPLDQFPRE